MLTKVNEMLKSGAMKWTEKIGVPAAIAATLVGAGLSTMLIKPKPNDKKAVAEYLSYNQDIRINWQEGDEYFPVIFPLGINDEVGGIDFQNLKSGRIESKRAYATMFFYSDEMIENFAAYLQDVKVKTSDASIVDLQEVGADIFKEAQKTDKIPCGIAMAEPYMYIAGLKLGYKRMPDPGLESGQVGTLGMYSALVFDAVANNPDYETDLTKNDDGSKRYLLVFRIQNIGAEKHMPKDGLAFLEAGSLAEARQLKQQFPNLVKQVKGSMAALAVEAAPDALNKPTMPSFATVLDGMKKYLDIKTR